MSIVAIFLEGAVTVAVDLVYFFVKLGEHRDTTSKVKFENAAKIEIERVKAKDKKKNTKKGE